MTTEYAAVVEPIENAFRATATAPFALTASGATADEALARLDTAIRDRLNHGARIVYRRIPVVSEHPLARFAGDLADDPLKDDWLAAMETYRHDAESDPNYL